MKTTFARPKSLTQNEFSYCPGCQHGVAHRLVAEVLDEFGIQNKTIGVYPVGCSVFAFKFFNVDGVLASHGRAPAVATGIKRTKPECVVFAYQGDGDLAAIGTSEIIHAANRGENITVIFINNAIYGMTGGQMAPTTLLGQETTTTPNGREALVHGNPIRVCEMLATLQGPAYLARVSLSRPKYIFAAKKAVRAAFKTQIENKGFSLVEILSACPVGWKLGPAQSLEWIEKAMMLHFPLGEFRTPQREQKYA